MLLFLDIETTGFEKTKDEILEISAVRYDEKQKKIVDTFDILLQLPEGIEVSPMIEGLTGISTEMCQNKGVDIDTAQQQFSDFILPEDIITGHNIQFDTGFLQEKGFIDEHTHYKEIDTFILSVLVLGQKEESHALEILTKKYGIGHQNAHRAMSDVLANLEFYCILERIYARQFSENFQNFLEKRNFNFEEQYFFDSVKTKKNKLLQEQLPTTINQNTQKKGINIVETQKDILQEIELSSLLSQKKSLFFETFEEQSYLISLLKFFQEKRETYSEYKNISILYPEKQKQEFFEYFLQLKNIFPEIQFFENPAEKICPDAYQKFLQKKDFSREESIVATKIFRGKELGQELFIRFMGDEWKPARELMGATQNNFPNDTVKILPFSQSKYLSNPNEIKIVFGAEKLEEMLLSQEQERFFSKRLQEDFSENAEKGTLDEIFQTLAQGIREEKGENPYSIKILWRDFCKMECFSAAQQQFQSLLPQVESENPQYSLLAKWVEFFAPPEIDQIKVLELFPDNSFAIETTNPFFEKTFQDFCLSDQSTLFFGKSFPKKMILQKNKNNTFEKKLEIQWSFSFPENFFWENFSDIKYFPPSVYVPSFPRDATPQELAQVIMNHWNDSNIIVSITSQKTANDIKSFLRKPAEENGVKIFSKENGGRGKIKKMIKNTQKKLVIGNTKFLEGLHLAEEDFSLILIHKIIFDHHKQPLIQSQRSRFKNDFDEYSIPRARARFEKDLFQMSFLSKGKDISIYVGDGRIDNSSTFYGQFKNVFPAGTTIKKWEE